MIRRNYVLVPLTALLASGLASPGCAASTNLEESTDSETDSASETAVDSESEGETDSAEIPEDAAPWPLLDCAYQFHAAEKATGMEVENNTYSTVDDVAPYEVIFSNELRTVAVYGADPFAEGGTVSSAESERESGDAPDEVSYILTNFGLGGQFVARRAEGGYISATLDFLGSGVPVLLRYRGYLEILDCGPPLQLAERPE